MNLGTRAVLYTVRKWKKTLLVFCLLLAITTAISNQIGSGLLSQVTAQTYETVDLTGNIESMEEPTIDLGLSEIKVTVSARDFLIVCAFGMVLCIASTALAAYPIMKMKPKSILSQMS